MSDLISGPRAANGSSRAAGPVPVPQPPPSGMRTPIEVMRHRQAVIQAKEQQMQGEAGTEQSRLAQQEEQRRTAERRLTGRDPPPRATEQIPTQPMYSPTNPPGGGMSGSYGQKDPLSSSFSPSPLSPAGLAAGVGGRAPPTSQSRAPQPNPQQASNTSTAGRGQTQQAQVPRQASAAGQTSQATQGPSVIAPQQQPQSNGAGNQTRSSNTSTFPHAFERWETLSSHWEGLTSYWIRRMEQHNDEIRRDPISQQMSRQITDLSAAGANLFHAVVELQRLRASSERKFQRWFFETRAEQERAQETQAELKAALDAERAKNADGGVSRQAAPAPVAMQQNLENDRRLIEARRELQISRDECRRAWEELGRREQLERDRVFSLRQGHAIDIGGVQVQPQNAPTQAAGTQRNRDDLYQQQSGQSAVSPIAAEYAAYEPQQGSPTSTDPFSGSERPLPAQTIQHSAYSQYPAEQARSVGSSQSGAQRNVYSPQAPSHGSGSRQVYSPQAPSQASSQRNVYASQPAPQSSAPVAYYDEVRQGPPQTSPLPPSVQQVPLSHVISEEDEGYELDEDPNYRQDAYGRGMPYRGVPAPAPAPLAPTNPGSSGHMDELDIKDVQREQIRAAAFGRADSLGQVPQRPPREQESVPLHMDTSPPQPQSQHQREPVSYAGEGWGDEEDDDEDDDGTGWEVQHGAPRHHHPSRLSSVMEEDERSRTSFGGVSRASAAGNY